MKDFTIVRKGFSTTEVDTYIVNLEAEIEKRDKKLEEYRAKEDAINRAVVDAQLIADAIVAKARAEAATIKHDASSELEDLRKRALTLRANLADFQESYNRILRRYLYASHCADMNQLYTRMETLLNNIDVDPDALSAMPPLQEQPQDDFMSSPVVAASAHVTADTTEPAETLEEFNTDIMKGE